MNRAAFASRRGFMAGAASLAFAPAACRRFRGGAPRWKTAVGLNGFESSARKYGKSYPLDDVLHFAKSEGFDGIELVERWPAAGLSGYPEASDGAAVRALREPADRHGLQIFSIQTGTAEAFGPEASKRAKWLDTFRSRAQLARALGCECIGMWPGGGLRGQSPGDALARLAESYRAAAGIAAEQGLVAAFEIEPPFVFNTEAQLQAILEAANHPNLRFIYDPSHFDLMNGSTGRPHEMLERLGVGRVGYVHLTDTDGTLRDGGTSKHLACGDGHARIPESLASLRDGGFAGWIMIDAWEIPDSYDACRKGKAAIDRARRG